ncbi:Ig-like domain-containing protein [Peribacillus psychrosaccharolyticus]|uniref:Ig-like domain-containing protein n=1 Tax=Peribacillus psychrosaccharolyticus TaxID=1407 RepID=UPI003D29CBEE
MNVSKITSKTDKVTVTSEKGATIIIKKGKTEIGKTTVNKKGNYTVKIKPQKKGSKLTIIALDKAGNKKEVTQKVE